MTGPPPREATSSVSAAHTHCVRETGGRGKRGTSTCSRRTGKTWLEHSRRATSDDDRRRKHSRAPQTRRSESGAETGESKDCSRRSIRLRAVVVEQLQTAERVTRRRKLRPCRVGASTSFLRGRKFLAPAANLPFLPLEEPLRLLHLKKRFERMEACEGQGEAGFQGRGTLHGSSSP